MELRWVTLVSYLLVVVAAAPIAVVAWQLVVAVRASFPPQPCEIDPCDAALSPR